MKVKKNIICFAVLLTIIAVSTFIYCEFNSAETQTVTRAAVDIGSGATKLRVAKVDLKSRKIVEILVNESFSVPYQEQLENNLEGNFDAKVMQLGIDALKKSQEIAKKHGADKVVALATAAFRKAKNSDAFAEKILDETGIKVNIIDQDLEGKLAFQAIGASVDQPLDDILVWDIGGGSFQFTALKDEDYFIYHGQEASIPFKNTIINTIQKKDPQEFSTPNPMTIDHIGKAKMQAQQTAKKVEKVFKKNIDHSKKQVIGVGNIFAYGIYPLIGKKPVFTAKELNTAVMNLSGKNDEQLGGGDFANVAVSNAILVLGFMESLGIQEMAILDVNNADGAMLHEPFWQGLS